MKTNGEEKLVDILIRAVFIEIGFAGRGQLKIGTIFVKLYKYVFGLVVSDLRSKTKGSQFESGC